MRGAAQSNRATECLLIVPDQVTLFGCPDSQQEDLGGWQQRRWRLTWVRVALRFFQRQLQVLSDISYTSRDNKEP